MTSATGRMLRRISPRSRAGSVFLVCGLLAGVLVATIGAGYTVSRPLLDDAGAYLAKGQGIVYANAESRSIEAEALAMSTGEHRIEPVTLSDGRVAIVNNETNEVTLLDPATMEPGPQLDYPDPAGSPSPLAVRVVPAPGGGYVVAGDRVSQIGPDGKPRTPVSLPTEFTGQIVPDATAGVWVLSRDGTVTHVVRDKVRHDVSADRRIKHLTVADNRPIGLTDHGDLLDLNAEPARPITKKPVPHDNVIVGSAKGPGRWGLVLDRDRGRLVAVDVRTGTIRTVDVPGRGHDLGAPVQLHDWVYVPDHDKHLLYVRSIGTGRSLDDIEVPGESETFSLEVHDGRVWVNDQFDRRAVVVTDGDSSVTVDKGEGPGLTDTDTPSGQAEDTEPAPSPNPSDTPFPPPSTADPRPPVETAPPVEPESAGIPDVVGLYTGDACASITAADLECVRQPLGSVAPQPTDLDVVTSQSPRAGSENPTDGTVSIRFHDKAKMSNYAGQPGAGACTAVRETYHTDKCTAVAGMSSTEYFQQYGIQLPAGTVYAQQPATNDTIHIGDSVTLTVTEASPVPDVRNLPPEQACDELERQGYTCDLRADDLARHRVVTDQDPKPNTPMDPGGTVIVHYAPHEPVQLAMYRRDNGDHVFAMARTDVGPPPGYAPDQFILGWGYDAGAGGPHLIPLYDHNCTVDVSKCFGFAPNRFYSRGTNTFPQWNSPLSAPSVVSDCVRPGLQPIYLVRWQNRPGEHKYTVRHDPTTPHPTLGRPDYSEPLGCVWAQ